jgi:putative ABC transport system permease protein
MVAISMIGLINAITLAVLERTREIGMLRCIDARARDVRRIFATEGLAVALAGWLIGVPLGFRFAHGIVMLSGDAVNQTVLFTFPLEDIPIALAGTPVLAILVMLLPLHRAVALSPGDALRYG